MKPKTKKIIIFIGFFIFLLMLFAILTNFILPVKTVIISGDVGKYNSGDILFYTESEAYEINEYILYKPSTKQVNYIAEIVDINSDGTFKVIGADPESIDELDQNNLKQNQIIGKIIYSSPFYIFYPISIIITIIFAYIITHFISKKIKQPEKQNLDKSKNI